MEPNTVGRDTAGFAPRTRREIGHSGVMAGTSILTANGDVPVHHLSVGNRIITRDAGMVRLTGTNLVRTHMRAVRVIAGALGHNQPCANVILPATHPVLLRGAVAEYVTGQATGVVAAEHLIDGRAVIDLGIRPMAVVQLGFDAPHVIYADGLELPIPAFGMAAAAAA